MQNHTHSIFASNCFVGGLWLTFVADKAKDARTMQNHAHSIAANKYFAEGLWLIFVAADKAKDARSQHTSKNWSK